MTPWDNGSSLVREPISFICYLVHLFIYFATARKNSICNVLCFKAKARAERWSKPAEFAEEGEGDLSMQWQESHQGLTREKADSHQCKSCASQKKYINENQPPLVHGTVWLTPHDITSVTKQMQPHTCSSRLENHHTANWQLHSHGYRQFVTLSGWKLLAALNHGIQ